MLLRLGERLASIVVFLDLQTYPLCEVKFTSPPCLGHETSGTVLVIGARGRVRRRLAGTVQPD